MTIKKKSFFFKMPSILLFSILQIFSNHTLANNTIGLKIYKGYRFSDGAVVETGRESTADISFYPHHSTTIIFNAASPHLPAIQSIQSSASSSSCISAYKMKEFGTKKPDIKAISLAEVNSWDGDSCKPPVIGSYYVLQSKNGQSLYLIKVVSFENPGAAQAYWKLNFSWKKIN